MFKNKANFKYKLIRIEISLIKYIINKKSLENIKKNYNQNKL